MFWDFLSKRGSHVGAKREKAILHPWGGRRFGDLLSERRGDRRISGKRKSGGEFEGMNKCGR